MNSHYSPVTRQIHLQPCETLYGRFHELAHKEQHEKNTLVFRAWVVGRWIRGVQWIVTVWIEFDAHQRARRAMEKLGLWNDAAKKEGWLNLKTYLTQRGVS
jgi:hypothetical protein